MILRCKRFSMKAKESEDFEKELKSKERRCYNRLLQRKLQQSESVKMFSANYVHSRIPCWCAEHRRGYVFTAASHPSRGSVPSATPPAASIATLLASLPSHSTTTPLSVTPAASLKASPLILSPALPPIPANLVEKILKGENLELKELLPDNVALWKKLDEVNIGGNPQGCALPSSSRL